MTVEVRLARSADAPALDHVLADAFLDDPLNAWLLPDERRRADALRRGMGHHMRETYLGQASAWTTGDLDGVALWAKPGDAQPGAFAQLRGLPTFVGVFRGKLPRALRAFESVEKRRPQEPHWFLDVIAVRPDRQGRGIGSALIRAGTEPANAAGAPCFLVTANERNLALYERHGFVVSEEYDLGPIHVWSMLRPPGAGAS